MSGEDFEVKTPEGELVLKVNGGNRVPIPGVEAWKKIMDGQSEDDAVEVMVD